MPAAQFDMNLDRGSTFKITLDLENTANEPVDLSNYSAEMQVRRSVNDDKMVCRLTDAWPQGCIGPGTFGEFYKNQGVTGNTGGIILNYQGVTGKILIEIDSITSYWGFQKPRSFYDLKLTNNGDNSVTTIIKGDIRTTPTLINTNRGFNFDEPNIVPLEPPMFESDFDIVSSTSPPQVGNPINIINFEPLSYEHLTILYTWYCDDIVISSATGPQYIPTVSDVGCIIRSKITLTNMVGSVFQESSLLEPVGNQQLSGSFVSIDTPVYINRFSTLSDDIVGMDSISYLWSYEQNRVDVPISTNSSVFIPDELLGNQIKCAISATGPSGGVESQIQLTSPSVNIQAPSIPVIGSYDPVGSLEPGIGFESEFVEKSTIRITSNSDLFASDSHAVFGLGYTPQHMMDSSGFILDMYAFHGSDIQSVTVSCDGGTAVTAGFMQSGGETGEGYFYINVDAGNFTPGSTHEIRATANPFNGFARSQQLLLSYPTGENKVSIDTSTTWGDAYLTVLENYDESKRNIIELTETGEYILESATTPVPYRGFTYGWIEVIPAAGVVPTIDLSTGGINRTVDNFTIRPKLNALKINNCKFKRMLADETSDAYDNGWYIEDFDTSRMLFDTCTFTSDWFDTGSYALLDNPRERQFYRSHGSIGKKTSCINCHFEQTANGPVGSYLTKNVSCNKVLKDTFTNVQFCINSISTDKLTPTNTNLHADHYQLFNSRVPDENGLVLMENYILYGYAGFDYGDDKVQPFGFFGTGRETYRDIAFVNSGWTGTTFGAAQAQLGLSADHVICKGIELYGRSLTFRSDGHIIGPILVQGVNAGRITNGQMHPLDYIAKLGTTNEFRDINNTPPIVYGGIPQSDSSLELKYEWHIAGASMASVTDRNVYDIEPTGFNTSLYIGVTAGGPEGPKSISNVFKLADNTARVSYMNISPTNGFSSFTLTRINSIEDANLLVAEDWYMTIQTDKGSMTSSDFRRRVDSTLCDFTGFGAQLFNGVTMDLSDMVNSATGVTFQLRQPSYYIPPQDRRPIYAEAFGSARSEIDIRERWGVASIAYRKTPVAGSLEADFNDPQQNGRLLWVDNQTKDLIPLGYSRFSFTNIQGWTTYDSGGSNAVVYQPHFPSNPYSGLELTEARVFKNLIGTTWDVSPTPFTNNGSNGFSDPNSIEAGTPGDNKASWAAAITYLRNELAANSVPPADQQIVAYAGYRPTYTDNTMTGIDRTLLGVSQISNRGSGDRWSGEGESPAYTPDVGFDGERPNYSYSVEAFHDWWGVEVNGVKSLGFDTIGLDTGTNMYMNSAGMYNTGVEDEALGARQGNTNLHDLFHTTYGVRTFTEAIALNYNDTPLDPVPWTSANNNNDISYTAGAAWALFGSWWGYVGEDNNLSTFGTSGNPGIIGDPVGGKVWFNGGNQQIGENGSSFNTQTTEIHCVFQWNDAITTYATAKVIAQTNGWTTLKQIMYDFHQAGVIVSVGGSYFMTNGGYLEGGTGNRITSSDFFGFVQDLANGQIVQRP